MLGAVIGDIAGSRFEFDNYRHTDFDIFSPDSDFTDDTICTVAIGPIGFYKAATIICPLFCKAGVGHIPALKAYMAAASHNG